MVHVRHCYCLARAGVRDGCCTGLGASVLLLLHAVGLWPAEAAPCLLPRQVKAKHYRGNSQARANAAREASLLA
jgi:hypothetical protein